MLDQQIPSNVAERWLPHHKVISDCVIKGYHNVHTPKRPD